MKHGRKRLLSILLTLVLVLGLAPGMTLTAYADGVTNYDLWVGNTQVTSTNMGNVLGDGTVSFAPANGDTPATLTLDGAAITTKGQKNSLIYCNLHSGDDPESIVSFALRGRWPRALRPFGRALVAVR